MASYAKYLDPRTLDKIKGLELKARLIVEGFLAGQHASPYKGSSVEFREHREYVPGDDVRFIDWKVYGKSDRFYIKEYEEETNLRAYIVLDTSGSMGYKGQGISKLEYAKYVAASLTHLIARQQDAVALVVWDSELKKFIPPGNNALHLKDIYTTLAAAEPRGTTDITTLLGALTERIRRKSVIILISDLLDADGPSLARGLRKIRHKGHDLILFQTLDPDELEFPFDRLTRFEGLEDPQHVRVDPKALRTAYLDALREFQQSVKTGCVANGMDYQVLDTGRPLDVALTTYLAARAGAR